MKLPARMALVSWCALLGLASCKSAGPPVKPDRWGPGIDFTGSWETNWGLVQLKQYGNSVEGSFRTHDGIPSSLTGKLDGNLLVFKWQDKGDIEAARLARSGKGYFRLNVDGDRFEGQWGYDESWDNGGNWTGKRAEKRE